MVIEVPRLDSTTFHLFGHRWPGLQAPQHTVLYDREHLLKFVEREIENRRIRLRHEWPC